MKLSILILFLVIITGCVYDVDVPKEKPIETGRETEQVDNRYDGEIITIHSAMNDVSYTQYNIKYTKEGTIMENYFLQELRPSLDWIKENTPEDSIFFNWWDYGHMIQGYTGREVVIFSPSKDILWSVASNNWDEKVSGPMSSSEKIRDVVFAFISNDPKVLKEKMQKYNSEYVFVSKLDKTIIDYWLEKLKDYPSITEIYSEHLIARMLQDEDIEGFTQVYSDNEVKIYKITEAL